jgi:hypothetical protein
MTRPFAVNEQPYPEPAEPPGPNETEPVAPPEIPQDPPFDNDGRTTDASYGSALLFSLGLTTPCLH